MILDGDILEYLESLGYEVKAQSDEEFTDFAFELEVSGYPTRVVLTMNHIEDSMDFLLGFRHPKSFDGISDAMNAINMNSSMFKCYYDLEHDCVILEAFTFVSEETVGNIIDHCLSGLLDYDQECIENLINTIYPEDDQPSVQSKIDQLSDMLEELKDSIEELKEYDAEDDEYDEDEYDEDEYDEDEYDEDEYDEDELEDVMDLDGASLDEILDEYEDEEDYSELEDIDGIA